MLRYLLITILLAMLISGCAEEEEDYCYYCVHEHPPEISDFGPICCPADPSKIAYTHFASCKDEQEKWGWGAWVFILDLDTGELTRVTYGCVTDWSRDGRYLLVYRLGNGCFLVDLETNQKTKILGDDTAPPYRFSPDGKKVAYTAPWTEEPLLHSVWILDLESGEKREVRGVNLLSLADWSPDGTEILLESCDVLSVADGRVTRRFEPKGGRFWNNVWNWGILEVPRWSPDGTKLLHIGTYFDKCRCPESVGIFTFDMNDSSGQKITCGRWCCFPCWSPDGSMIAYSDLAVNRSDSIMAIWIASVDGKFKKQVTLVEPYPGCEGAESLSR